MVKVKFSGFGVEKEVEASTGDILLRVAKDNGVKIPCECEDGECGSCAVEVLLANPEKRTTERLDSQGKELATLVGKAIMTKKEAEELEMYDRVPKVRLACQMIVRDDMTVKPYNA
jgi:ferredoxin